MWDLHQNLRTPLTFGISLPFGTPLRFVTPLISWTLGTLPNLSRLLHLGPVSISEPNSDIRFRTMNSTAANYDDFNFKLHYCGDPNNRGV